MFRPFTNAVVEKRKKNDEAIKEAKSKMFKELKVQEIYLSGDIPVPIKIQLDYYDELLDLYRKNKKTLPEIALEKEHYKKKVNNTLRLLTVPLLFAFFALGIFLFNDYGVFFTIFVCSFVMISTFIIITILIKQSEKSFNEKMMSNFSKKNP